MKRTLFLIIIAIFSLAACKKDSTGKAAFITSKSSYYLTEPVTLSNTSSDAKTYSWNFGDGTTSTDQSPKHAYSKAGIYKIQLVVNGSSTTEKSIKVNNGTASYQISNTTGYDIPFVSYAVDATSNLTDFVDHGILTSGSITDTIYTNDTQIYVGGTLPNDSTLVVVPVYKITPLAHKVLVVDDDTQIFVDKGSDKNSMDQLFHSKTTALKRKLMLQTNAVKHTAQ